MVRPVSVGRKARLSLSLSLSLSRTKKTKRAVFEQQQQREVNNAFSKVLFFSSNNTRESFHLFPRRRVQKLTRVLLSLSLVRITQGTPPQRRPEFGRLDGRYVHSFCIFSARDALVFSRAPCVGWVQTRNGRERERIEILLNFSPPLCVSLSQFFVIDKKCWGVSSLSSLLSLAGTTG